jgi:tRNA A37 threonylcarbamoyladenosine synthetase subunit TsaC/SUA5/YrdC
MSQFFQVHPDNPQARLIKQAAQIIHGGGIVAAADRFLLRAGLPPGRQGRRRKAAPHPRHRRETSPDLAVPRPVEIGVYARVDNRQFRLLKAATPGPFTFILEATREACRAACRIHRARPSACACRKTRSCMRCWKNCGQPLLGTTLIMPGETDALNDADTICERLEKQIDLIIDGGACSMEPTTVIDLTGPEAECWCARGAATLPLSAFDPHGPSPIDTLILGKRAGL